MRAIQIEEFGGPEKLRVVDVEDPTPGEGEVLVEVARSGINFADTHATRNDYLAEQTLPLIPGADWRPGVRARMSAGRYRLGRPRRCRTATRSAALVPFQGQI